MVTHRGGSKEEASDAVVTAATIAGATEEEAIELAADAAAENILYQGGGVKEADQAAVATVQELGGSMRAIV